MRRFFKNVNNFWTQIFNILFAKEVLNPKERPEPETEILMLNKKYLKNKI